MTRKQYYIKLGVGLFFFFLGFSSLITAAVLQDMEAASTTVINTFGFSFFPLMVIALIILAGGYKKSIIVEHEIKLEKLKKTNKGSFTKRQMNLSKEKIINKFKRDSEVHELTEDAVWYKYGKITINSFICLAIFNGDNDPLSVEKSLDDEIGKYVKMMNKISLPKAGTHVTVFFSIVEDVTSEYIKEMERMNKEMVALSRTVYGNPPMVLFYVLDQSRNEIYYEENKKVPFGLREGMLKKMNEIVIGKKRD